VTIVDLWNNQIGVEGATALADTLKVNMSVTTISLGHNQIGIEGASALAEALKVNTSLTYVYLGFNGVDKSNLATVKKLTDRNIRLHRLFVFDAQQMALLSVMCADECGVVWPYLMLSSRSITDHSIAMPDNVDALRATLASVIAEQ
jgi:hypothetical protein